MKTSAEVPDPDTYVAFRVVVPTVRARNGVPPVVVTVVASLMFRVKLKLDPGP